LFRKSFDYLNKIVDKVFNYLMKSLLKHLKILLFLRRKRNFKPHLK